MKNTRSPLILNAMGFAASWILVIATDNIAALICLGFFGAALTMSIINSEEVDDG